MKSISSIQREGLQNEMRSSLSHHVPDCHARITKVAAAYDMLSRDHQQYVDVVETR